MNDVIRKYREALFLAAPSHQGGHSATGAAIAECLGVPFPISFPAIERAAKSEGFDPAELWPWLMKMRSDVAGRFKAECLEKNGKENFDGSRCTEGLPVLWVRKY